MADYDYLPINDDEMLPGRPVKTSLAFRWRNNAIAMIQGGVNAPRIEVPAFGTPAVGNVAQYYREGITDLLAASGPGWNDVPYAGEHSNYRVEASGTYRLATQYVFSGTGYNWGYQIHKNGSPIGTNWQELGVSGTRTGSHVEDFAFVAGDLISIVFRGDNGSEGNVFLSIGTDKPSKFPLVSHLI